MVVIIVEGKTDSEFLQDFIENQFEIERNIYDFKGLKGKDYIFSLHDNSMYDKIENKLDIIEKILIAVDADDPKDTCEIRGYEVTESKLSDLIKKLEYSIPIDYFIFSDKAKERGYLESFMLSVLDEDQKKCVNEFKMCYKYELTDKWVFNTFYKQRNHPFDYNHSNFAELRKKLTNLFKEYI